MSNMSNIILCNLSDANEMISEAQKEWVENLLLALNIDEGMLDDDIYVFRSKMEEIGIEVVLYSSGEVDVFKKVWFDDGFNQGWLPAEKKNLVGQWKLPEKIKKIDEKGVYYEIHLKEWTI